jgi:hypothetical protein
MYMFEVGEKEQFESDEYILRVKANYLQQCQSRDESYTNILPDLVIILRFVQAKGEWYC